MNLNQIFLPVINIEESIEFYQKLGHLLIVKALPDYARFECKEGELTFSLHKVENNSFKGVWVYFEVSNVDECVKELSKVGFSFDELPTDKSWLWREARIKDPDGNQLIIYTAGNNRKNPPWRI